MATSERNDLRGQTTVTDLERLQFWKEEKLLTSIPVRLLLLTNWFGVNQDEVFVASSGESGNEIKVGPLKDMLDSQSIIFKAPTDKLGRNRLEDILSLLRTKQRELDQIDALIRKRKQMGDEDETRKDVMYLKRLEERVRAPHPMIDGAINAFLDTMRFQVSEMGLSEMRYQSPIHRMALQQRVEEMDSD